MHPLITTSVPNYNIGDWDCSVKKVFLKVPRNSQENTCAGSLFLIKVAGLQPIKKETLIQVFSCKYFEIFKNFLTEPLW